MDFQIDTWPPAVIASLLAAAVATLGLLTVLVKDGWAQRNQLVFSAFAAGILLTSALTLFPEALAANPNAPFLALGGYLLLYGINVLSKSTPGAAVTPLLAIGLHSFIDGFEYGILFDHDLWVGIVASIGLVSHEFAEGVILYALMRGSGAGRWVSLLGAFIGAALTTPLGAVASQSVLANSSEEMMGMLLAAASGALLYLGATHLPMHLNKGRRTLSPILAYIVGTALALSLSFSGIHNHGDAHHDHDEHADEDAHHHDEKVL